MTHIIYDYLIHTIYDVHTIYLFPCWLVFIAPKTWGLVSTAEKIFELDYAFDVPWIVETREKPRMVSSCWIIFQGLIKNAELFIVTSFFTSFFWFCLKQWLCKYIGHIMNVSWWTPRKQLLVAWSLKRFGRMRSRRACQVEDSGRKGRNSSQTCSISDGNLSIRRRNSGILDEVFQTSDALNDKKVLYSALHLLFEHLNFSMFARRP